MQVTTSNARRRLGGERFGGDQPVVDRDAGFEPVQPRDAERLLGEVDAGHARAARAIDSARMPPPQPTSSTSLVREAAGVLARSTRGAAD